MNSVLVLSASRAVFESLSSILGARVSIEHRDRLADAHHLLAQRPIDVVIVDTELRDCDGAAAVRAIARGRSMPTLIALTLNPRYNGLPREESRGLFAYLTKPFEADQVRFVVERAIERAELHRRVEHLNHRVHAHDQAPAMSAVPGREPAGDSRLSQRCARVFARETEPAALATSLVEVLAEELLVTSTAVLLSEDAAHGFALAAAFGLDEQSIADAAFQHGRGLAGWLARHGVVLRRDDIARAADYDTAATVTAELDLLRAEVVVPLTCRGRLLGFLTLGRRLSGAAFAAADVEALAVIGAMASLAFDNCQARHALAFEKLCAERIIAGLDAGIIVADARGDIITCNAAAIEALDLDVSPLGQALPALGSQLSEIADEALRSGQRLDPVPLEHETSGRALRVHAIPLGDEPAVGEIAPGVLLVIEEAARQPAPRPAEDESARMPFWSELAARMAHKLKNPLVSIKTFTQLLPERYGDEQFRTSFLGIVDAEADKINEIADRLLLYSSAPAREPVPVDVPALVEKVLQGFAERAEAAGVKVVCGLDEVPAVVAGPERLTMALRSLIENALDAMEGGGRLGVRTRLVEAAALSTTTAARVLDFSTGTGRAAPGGAPGAFIAIEVSDTGRGMPPELVEKAFQPFHSDTIRGIGLGLAIVAKVVREHNGRIELTSTPGRGTDVRLLLPAGC
ncbi:MAG: GAF domain-containing protein [Verrucomicrobia bacterium]|nr:GAF domain-containing protein [Verrucomicrobiota bacterium]